MHARARARQMAETPPAGPRYALRKCLGRCDREFLSEGPWHRICRKCARRNTAHGWRGIACARVAAGSPASVWLREDALR